jgi:hypothetical protein
LSDFAELSDQPQVTVSPDPAGDAAVLVVPDEALVLFAVLGRRWAPHLLYLLGQRPARFTELQHAVPRLSAASLNDRLRDLTKAGLIVRHTFPGPPMTSSCEVTPNSDCQTGGRCWVVRNDPPTLAQGKSERVPKPV